MDYLIRLVQVHETFRRPELEALAVRAGIEVEIVFYSSSSPFCIVRFPLHRAVEPRDGQISTSDRLRTAQIARSFISRSILAKGIYELWGAGVTYSALHDDIRLRTGHLWNDYLTNSFKFSLDAYFGKRSTAEQRSIINSFSYLGFRGKIVMKNPQEEFVVFEEWNSIHPEQQVQVDQGSDVLGTNSDQLEKRDPKMLYFGRFVGGTSRGLAEKHDLKKRPYISTTSMDAELALVTANLALAGPGKLLLDPFVGTGGFMVAAAELGAVVFGSDIDGRSFRGKGNGVEHGVGANFRKYQLQSLFGDCVTCDLTNTPFRLQQRPEDSRWIDGILCDPPYGVREGLKVLGRRTNNDPNGVEEVQTSRRATGSGPFLVDGELAHKLPGYVAPKKPYSFNRMLDDILDFAARVLVDGGRLAFWMPSANETDENFGIPSHPTLELKHTCIQIFNKWSRRLLVYERIAGTENFLQNGFHVAAPCESSSSIGRSADELNPFRKRYFKGFSSTK